LNPRAKPANDGRTGLRIAFAGTPEFAAVPLQAMLDEGHAPLVVLTQPDRPAGRGRALQASPVKHCAERAGIPVLQPRSLRDASVLADLAAWKLDLLVVVAYGLILPPGVLRTPRYGCWNIHASLLPRWRGAAPIQRAIEAGDPTTGVCIMQMAEGLDTGPVYLCRETEIAPEDTAGTLHDRLADLGAAALLECLELLESGAMPEPVGQDERRATYAAKLDKAEARLAWSAPAAEIGRRIRAFNPWPVCWSEVQGERLRIWRAEAVEMKHSFRPGTVVAAGADGIVIAAADGLVRLLEVQRAGGRRMPAAEYLKAHPLRAGE